ncbi:hypothetical protein [Mesobacillus subterraneus]|uniref:hypothetical protein n=1 Tax=Mesobacillus subterraneus TaxID=285983 RepID=UPI001CFF14E7|nr:hypothetical protein [Mesobacillus subterraneus]
MNKILKMSAFALLSISLTACSEAAVKDASLDDKNEKDLPPIHEDYSSNWWKDQPNGNADTNTDWDGEGWILSSNEVSNGVAIADIKTGNVVKYFQSSGTPHHVHLNKEQTWAFATQRYGTSVLAINMETLESHNIDFPGFEDAPAPQHMTMSLDGKYAFTSLNGVGAVGMIDANTAELVKVFKDVGKKPRDLNVTPDGKKLFVSLQAESFITVIDIETGDMRYLERTETDYGKGTGSGLDMSNDGKLVAVSNTADNEVAVYDAKTEKLLKKFGDIPKPVNVSFMGDTYDLVTGNRNDGSISIIDADKLKFVKTIKTGPGTNIPYLGPDGYWYTSQNGAGYLTVMDPEDNYKIVRKIWGVQNIHWLAWSPDGSMMFGSNWGDKTLTKIDLTKKKDFRQTIPVGLNPNGIALKTNVPKDQLVKYQKEINAEEANRIKKASTLVFPEARNINEEAFLGTCLQCHDIGRIMRNNSKGPEAWTSVVDRMKGNGAKMTDEQRQQIIDYLASDEHKSLSIQTELEMELAEQNKDKE